MASTRVPPQAYTKEILTKAFEWLKKQPESVKERALSADSLVHLYMQGQKKTLSTTKNQIPLSFANTSLKPPTNSPSPRVEDFKVKLQNLSSSSNEKLEEPPTENESKTSLPQRPTKTSKKNLPNHSQKAFPHLQSKEEDSAEKKVTKPNKKKSKQVSQESRDEVSLFNFQQSLENQEETHFLQEPSNEKFLTPQPPTLYNQKEEQSLEIRPPQETTSKQLVPEEIIDQKTMKAVKDVQKMLNLSSEKEAVKALVSIGYKQISQLFKI